MLRYLKAVQMMKQIIEENNLTVMSTIARYACAYESIAKPDWWDKSKRLVSDSRNRNRALNFCHQRWPHRRTGNPLLRSFSLLRWRG